MKRPLDDEERELRRVAMENARSVLAARRRAEEELLHAKEELERKSSQLEAWSPPCAPPSKQPPTASW